MRHHLPQRRFLATALVVGTACGCVPFYADIQQRREAEAERSRKQEEERKRRTEEAERKKREEDIASQERKKKAMRAATLGINDIEAVLDSMSVALDKSAENKALSYLHKRGHMLMLLGYCGGEAKAKVGTPEWENFMSTCKTMAITPQDRAYLAWFSYFEPFAKLCDEFERTYGVCPGAAFDHVCDTSVKQRIEGLLRKCAE